MEREQEKLQVAEARAAAERAQITARAALIVASMAIAVAVFGMFLPIG